MLGEGLGSHNKKVPLMAVPYYAWANRENNAMEVWINETPAEVLLKDAP